MPRKKKVEVVKAEPEKRYHVFFDGCCDAGGFYVETSNRELSEAVCPDCGETATRVITVIELS